MSTAGALTEHEITEARGELAAGRPVTVWFTDAAVGVPVGGSARLVAVGEQAAGEFLQVRPAGSRDELFCAPSELTRTRPSRRKAAAAAAAPPRPKAEPVVAEPAPAPARPAPARAARPRTNPEITVTLHAGPDGEWSVAVAQGRKPVVRPTPVAPNEVAKAARVLPAAVGAAVDASLAAARARQQERVAALRSELEAAEQALQELGGESRGEV